jgi:hypothetical protein
MKTIEWLLQVRSMIADINAISDADIDTAVDELVGSLRSWKT